MRVLVFLCLMGGDYLYLGVAIFCQSSAILIKDLSAVADTGFKMADYKVNLEFIGARRRHCLGKTDKHIIEVKECRQ